MCNFCTCQIAPSDDLKLLLVYSSKLHLIADYAAAESLEWGKGKGVTAILDAEDGQETTVEEENTCTQGNDEALLEVLVGLSGRPEDERNDHERECAV
jgi:hypothetical protein